MTKQQITEQLAGMALFRGTSPSDLDNVAARGTLRTVAAGTQLVRQGAMGFDCLLIVDGSAAVERHGELVATVGAGEFIGELTLIDHGPRSATVTAITPMTLIEFTHKGFATIVAAVPNVAERVAAQLAAREQGSEPVLAARLHVAGSRLTH
jgi:CRP-like cAMP-binding protein